MSVTDGIFAYISHTDVHGDNRGDVFVLRLDATSGKVSPVQQIEVPGQAMPMAVSPDRRFLFVALRSEPYLVMSFAIDALSGKLTHLSNAPLYGSMTYISVDRTGRFLLGASNTQIIKPKSSFISVSAIGPQGFVQPSHQIVRTEPKAHAILADPANQYVLVTCCDGDVILRQVFDCATGTFSSQPLSPVRVKPNAGPRHFVFHPNERFVYLLTETDATIYVFSYDASGGALTERQIVTAVPADPNGKKRLAADLRLTPDGKFLYVSERTSNVLASFRVDLISGLLSPMGTFKTANCPRSFAIDPYGRHLLAVGQDSDSVTSYGIDRHSGELAEIEKYPVGKGPNWIEVIRLP